jgi:ribosomal-protein-alanine N-acetyltransferase
MSGVTVVEGGRGDLGAVMEVMGESFDPRFGEAWTAPQCAGLLPLPGVWLTLARAAEDTIGFALSRIIADEAELLLLAVRRPAQGRGAGNALLQRFIADARARGAGRLHLEVREGNPAVALYRRAGFSEVGRRRNYYRGPGGEAYDALTLARPIEG